jgi:hypothetical protein
VWQNWKGLTMRSLMLVVATLLSCSVKASEAPPGFDPASVPEHLRVLEGRTAFIKIPSQDDAPLSAAQGAVLSGNVPAQVVTPANTTWIPLELALRGREFDRFVQGYISEADLIAFMDKQGREGTGFVLLEDGAAVRIIAPRVGDGFATQVLPLTGHMSATKLGNEVHVWVDSCFLRFGSAADQELLSRDKAACR